MRKQLQTLRKQLARGGSFHNDQKRDTVIRVREWKSNRLGELGSSRNDYDDVISMLIEFWENEHNSEKK